MGKLEKDIVSDIKKYLKSIGAKPIKYHGSAFSEAGIPDLLVCYKGMFIWIEVKRRGQKCTPIQIAVQNELKGAGAIGLVAYDLMNVKFFINQLNRD